MADIDRAMATDWPDELLITAIRKNDLATARHLLNRNVSPDEPYSDPPLSVAIRHQRLDIVQLLYEHNVKGFMDEFNRTEIHVAARVGNLAILEFIWNKLKPRHQHDGFLHRADLDGMTPLHYGAASGSLDCVRFLLREGADVNSCPEHGMTPLHYAAKSPNAREIIEVLVQAGAQVDAAASNGESALFGAVESDDKDAVAALLRAGASVTLRNQYNETVLHTAAYSSSLSLLQTLVDAGADMTAQSTSNSTILHRAAEAGRVETVAWILQHTHLPADDANSYGWTPLHFAAAKDHLSTVKFLVEECGADISALPSFPRNASALHLATHCFGEDPIPRANCTRPVADNTSLISYLLAHGADVWARADDGILMGGYESGENIFIELHECTSGPESEDDCDTVTPLDCAAAIGSIPKAQALLAAGADINARSRTGMGWTALLHAVTGLSLHSPEGPITPIIRFLIQNGADVRIVDTKGRSVVHYLCYYLRATEPVREFLVETGVYKEDLEAALDLKVIPGLMRDLIYQNQS
jgi:ankyrin repeat protein